MEPTSDVVYGYYRMSGPDVKYWAHYNQVRMYGFYFWPNKAIVSKLHSVKTSEAQQEILKYLRRKRLYPNICFWFVSRVHSTSNYVGKIASGDGGLVTKLCVTLSDPMDCRLSGSSVHRDSPGKNSGVHFHALLQGIFLTWGSKLGLLHCRWFPALAGGFFTTESPGKPRNLGMFGQIWCNLNFIIQVIFYMNADFLSSYCVSEDHSVVSHSLWPHGLYSPWNSPGQNTRMGSHSLLQGIFLTQGCNPGLPHCREILYQLSHQGSLSSYYVPAFTCITFINLNNSMIGVLIIRFYRRSRDLGGEETCSPSQSKRHLSLDWNPSIWLRCS